MGLNLIGNRLANDPDSQTASLDADIRSAAVLGSAYLCPIPDNGWAKADKETTPQL